ESHPVVADEEAPQAPSNAPPPAQSLAGGEAPATDDKSEGPVLRFADDQQDTADTDDAADDGGVALSVAPAPRDAFDTDETALDQDTLAGSAGAESDDRGVAAVDSAFDVEVIDPEPEPPETLIGELELADPDLAAAEATALPRQAEAPRRLAIAPKPAPQPEPPAEVELASVDLTVLGNDEPTTPQTLALDALGLDEIAQQSLQVIADEPEPLVDLATDAPPASTVEVAALPEGQAPLIAPDALADLAQADLSSSTIGEAGAVVAPEPVDLEVEEKSKRKTRKPRVTKAKQKSAPAMIEVASEPVVEEPVEQPAPEPHSRTEPERVAQIERIVEPAPSLSDDVEVLEVTEPTPASALDLDEAIAFAPDDDLAPQSDSPDVLTDSTFGHAVSEFAGDASELVEADELAEAPASDEDAEALAAEALAGDDALATESLELGVDELPESMPEDADAGATLVSPESVEEEDTAAQVSPLQDASEVNAEAPAEQELASEPARVDPTLPAAPTRAAPAVPMNNLSLGAAGSLLGTDQANFIGGMPLRLAPLTPKKKGATGTPRETPQTPPGQKRRVAVAFGDRPVSAITPPVDDDAPLTASVSVSVERGEESAAPPALDEVPAPEPRNEAPVAEAPVTALESPALSIDEAIPPFTGETPTAGRVTMAFDGLAMPPVRQTDVFSQLSPPAKRHADHAFSAAAEDLSIPTAAERDNGEEQVASRLSPGEEAAGDAPNEDFWAAQDEAAANGSPLSGDEAETDQDQALSPLRPMRRHAGARGGAAPAWPGKRGSGEYVEVARDPRQGAPRRRRVPIVVLLLLMLACMGAAAYGVWKLLPPQLTIEGTLQFKNLDALGEGAQRKFIESQRQLLTGDNEKIRRFAMAALKARPQHAGISPGFLEDTVEFFRSVNPVEFPAARKNIMLVKAFGTDKRADAARMEALLAALYKANGEAVVDTGELRAVIAGTEDAIRRLEASLDALRGESNKARVTAAVTRASADTLARLKEEADRLEEQWMSATSARQALEVELDRLSQAAPADSAPNNAAPAPEEDDQLKVMTQELSRVNARLTEIKSVTDEQATAARKKLDESIDQFQKQIATAGDTMKDNPELAAYVESARKLQEATRQLTGELIHRQQEQYAKLNEYKRRWADSAEALRNAAWEKDDELKQLNDELAIAQR
ncbi:MAG: hypothetical protein ACREIT_06800, partial [Tepidisphaeraceae bacterium]